MTVKVTFFLNAVRAAVYQGQSTPPTGVAGYRGITESWFSELGFDSSQLNNQAEAWMTKRVPMMPLNTTIVAYRQTEVGARGKTVTYEKSKAGTNGFIQDLSEAALRYKARSTTSAAERSITLAALPDDIIIGGVFASADNWINAVNIFMDEIQSQWKLQAVNQTVPTFDIVSIDVNGNVVTAQDTDIIATSKVQILHGKSAEGVSIGGVYKLESRTDAKHFKLLGYKAPAAVKGIARRYAYLYESLVINNGQRNSPHVTTRKWGRPFGASRGKASTKR